MLLLCEPGRCQEARSIAEYRVNCLCLVITQPATVALLTIRGCSQLSSGFDICLLQFLASVKHGMWSDGHSRPVVIRYQPFLNIRLR